MIDEKMQKSLIKALKTSNRKFRFVYITSFVRLIICIGSFGAFDWYPDACIFRTIWIITYFVQVEAYKYKILHRVLSSFINS